MLEILRCAVIDTDEPGNEFKALCRSNRCKFPIVIGRSGLCW